MPHKMDGIDDYYEYEDDYHENGCTNSIGALPLSIHSYLVQGQVGSAAYHKLTGIGIVKHLGTWWIHSKKSTQCAHYAFLPDAVLQMVTFGLSVESFCTDWETYMVKEC